MYSPPEIVFGFHGCDKIVADKVIKNSGKLSNSENSYDWLGSGIYFWEGDHDRALEWAKNNTKISAPSVIGAVIKLGNCLDLLDSKDIRKVETTYKIYKEEREKLNEPLHQNRNVDASGISFNRRLDCAVIMRLHQLNNEGIVDELRLKNSQGQNKRQIQRHGNYIDSVRGMFPEGVELYPGAGFRSKNHIQLCILNPNCILGYFEPQKHNAWYKKL